MRADCPRPLVWLALLSSSFIAACGAAEPAPAPPRATRAAVRVLPSPHVLRRGDARHLVLELELSVADEGAPALERVETDGTSLGPTALREATVRVTRDPDRVSRLRREAPGDRLAPRPEAPLVVFLWLPIPDPPPEAVRLALAFDDGDAREVTIAVPDDPPLVLRPPLTGPGWFAFAAPANDSPHRRALFDVDGGRRIAQRFAIDLLRVDERGQRRRDPDGADNASYLAYGAPVLSVAPGRVVAVRDGIPENAPAGCDRAADPSAPCAIETAVPMTRQTLAGNHVIVDLGEGRHAVYAHLAPSSVEVAVGDEVRAGDRLGAIGNSGNASEPHLHFHVCDGPSVVECDGVPFAFERFVEIPIELPAGRAGRPVVREASMPRPSTLLMYPDSDGALPAGPG